MMFWSEEKKKKRAIDPKEVFEYIEGRHDYKLVKLCADNKAHNEPVWLELNHENWEQYQRDESGFDNRCRECRKLTTIEGIAITYTSFFYGKEREYVRNRFIQNHKNDSIDYWNSVLRTGSEYENYREEIATLRREYRDFHGVADVLT